MKKIYTLVALTLGLNSSLMSQWTDVTMPNLNSFVGMTNIGSKLVACSATGVYSTTDEGQNWTTISNGIPVTSGYTFSNSLSNYDGVLYSGTTLSTLYKSSDQGANWTEAHSNFFAGFGSPDHTFFYQNGNLMITAFGESGGMKYSTDNGQNWDWVDIWGANKSIGKNIVEVAGNLFAPTITGPIKSTNNGVNWELITGGGLPPINGQGCNLMESNGNLILSVYLTGTFLSTDGGVNWTSMTGSLGETLSAITCIEGNDNVVFIGGPSGYFQSDDHGQTWVSIKDNLTTSQVTYSMRLVGSTLFMCDLMGTHKRTVDVQTSDLTEKKDISLSLYPNPTSSTINLLVNDATKYKIFNLLGHVVQEGTLNQGKNQLNIENIAKGNYFLKVENEVKQITINN